MHFSDSTVLKGLRRTSDGYLTGQVRAARTGTQVYTRKELKLDGDAEALITVYRPPEAVFDEGSLKTYAGKPITLGHPKESVSAGNWKDLAVGTVGSKVLRDGESVVVDFSIMDAAAITAIENGTREVSMGYSTPMELRDGVTPKGEPYQALQIGPIRINHLAIVAAARGGSDLRFADSAAENWGASPVNHKENEMTTKVVVLGDAAVTVALTDALIVETFRNHLQKQLTDAAYDFEKMKKEKDEEIGNLKAKKKILEDAAITPASLSKMITDRVALEGKVKLLDAAIVCDGVSDEELQKKAVIARLGDEAVLDASTAQIQGMFRALTIQTPNDSVRQALQGQNITDSATGSWSDGIAASAGVTFKKKGA